MKRRVEFIMMKNRKASKIGTAAAYIGILYFWSGLTVFGMRRCRRRRPTNATVIPQSASFKETNALSNIFADSNIHFETENHAIISVSDSDLEP